MNLGKNCCLGGVVIEGLSVELTLKLGERYATFVVLFLGCLTFGCWASSTEGKKTVSVYAIALAGYSTHRLRHKRKNCKNDCNVNCVVFQLHTTVLALLFSLQRMICRVF